MAMRFLVENNQTSRGINVYTRQGGKVPEGRNPGERGTTDNLKREQSEKFYRVLPRYKIARGTDSKSHSLLVEAVSNLDKEASLDSQ